MKRNLLVTIANQAYADQVKQLFGGVYQNAGWDGDYMLLTPDMDSSSAAWFEERGITVQNRSAYYDEDEWVGLLHPDWPTTTIWTLKYYLLSEEFKQWEHIVYLDADIMVRGSLSALVGDGFNAVINMCNPIFKGQFTNKNIEAGAQGQLQQFEQKFSWDAFDFNAGVFGIHTGGFNGDLVKQLDDALRSYGKVSRISEQCFMNLVFYDRWRRAPLSYNVCVPMLLEKTQLRPSLIEGHVLHFNGGSEKKPWEKQSPFYDEWKRNLEAADNADFRAPPQPAKTLNRARLQLTSALCYMELKARQKSTYRKIRRRLAPLLRPLS